MSSRVLPLVGLAVILAPGLFAEDPRNLQEAMEQMRRRIAELESQVGDTGKLRGAFGTLEQQVETQGTLTLPDLGRMAGRAGPGGAAGSMNLGGIQMQGNAGPGGATGGLSLPGISLQGGATPGGATGSISIGGIRIQGSASEGGASGGITIPGLGTLGGRVSGGLGGPTASFTGPSGEVGEASFGEMLQSLGQGGMYAAGLTSLKGAIAMLKAGGQPTADLEREVASLEPELRALDQMQQQIMSLVSQGQAPPEALTDGLEDRADAAEDRLEALEEQIEARSEALELPGHAPSPFTGNR